MYKSDMSKVRDIMDDIEVRELEECSIWSFEASVRSGEACIRVKEPRTVEQIIEEYLGNNVTMCLGESYK